MNRDKRQEKDKEPKQGLKQKQKQGPKQKKGPKQRQKQRQKQGPKQKQRPKQRQKQEQKQGPKQNQEQEQKLEQLLESFMEEMVTDLNLRLLADMDGKACKEEQLLWVERITLTEVKYPAAPGGSSFLGRLRESLAALWRRVKFW